MKTSIISCLAAFILFALAGRAQVTYQTNNPTANPLPLGFVGWNDNSNENLDIRQNNFIRMRFNGEDWPGYNSITNIDDVNRIFLPVEDGVLQPNVFSILQLGEQLDPLPRSAAFAMLR